MSDLGRRRDKYRGRGVWFLPGLVLFGYGWFWLPLRVSESVGRIVNSVLLTVWMGLVRAAKQATDFGEGREGHRQEHSYACRKDKRKSVGLLVPRKMWISAQVVDNSTQSHE